MLKSLTINKYDGRSVRIVTRTYLENLRQSKRIPMGEIATVDNRSKSSIYNFERSPVLLSMMHARLMYLKFLGYHVSAHQLSEEERVSVLGEKYPEVVASPEYLTTLRKALKVSLRDVDSRGVATRRLVSDMEVQGLGVTMVQSLQMVMRYGIYIHIEHPNAPVSTTTNPVALSISSKMAEYDLDIDDIAVKSGVTPAVVRRIITDDPVSVSDLYRVMQGIGLTMLVEEF
ncbi:conserved hypothetical protein [Vibrio phage 150E35-1]|nr:conserved hypothetical protein [Vibrio phage 150E35-1]